LKNPLTTKVGVALDSFGRSFLTTFDYRLYSLAILIALIIFCAWRKGRYKSYPTQQDCFDFVTGLIGLVGALIVMAVFLLTKPPAIDALSGQVLGLIGLLVPIIIFGKAGPQLKALLSPRRLRNRRRIDSIQVMRRFLV
jgi:hypothetical protein